MALKSVKIYQLKITLDSIRPPIWRRVQVRSDISLGELHDVIQAAMGWYNCHLHQFDDGENQYGIPEPDFNFEVKDESKKKLSAVLPFEKTKIKYEYDFGDGWRHTILLEKILPVEPGVEYPRCLTGKRACPPEDCGGPYGYPDFLESISNPDHERHQDMLEWIGGEFDPEEFDVPDINAVLHAPKLDIEWLPG